MDPSSAAPFLDEVAESGLAPSGDLAHEILGQLQIALRAGQPNMSKIRGEERQRRAEVNILLTPQQKAENRERMSKAVEPNAAVGCPFDADGLQQVMEGPAERGDGIPASARAGEQRHLGETGPVVLGCDDAAVNQALDQIRCHRDHSRLVEFAMTDKQRAGVEIEVGLRKPQQLPSPQSSQIQKA